MASEVLNEVVKAPVTESWKTALEGEADRLSATGMRVTTADVVRTALFEFFKRRKIKIGGANGKAKP